MTTHNNLLKRLTFKTSSYRKNYDLEFLNDNFITEHEGIISEIRLTERKPPFIIGEFSISTWNFHLARILGVNLIPIFAQYEYENAYEEVLTVIDTDILNVKDIDKLIVVKNLIIHPEYRKKGVTEEFVEYLYRDHYIYGNNKLVALVKPLQDNFVDYDYYTREKGNIRIREMLGEDAAYRDVTAKKYFAINKLTEKKDTEFNEYKIFAVASRCGFVRLGESHIFEFTPHNAIERLRLKLTDNGIY